ncbi:NAD-dependent epimerase/dehydratase family protein [Lederbergia sp. NSJ-179]|uniref:NAD-dependent epimerase/dehydratase family protein n=1 Tax=Lederbergia sp. NSJ-179 TaxID=2931402 RepID=UPI001FD625EA|nr:NAD-dependent epimerase/dehydratase family protein [Lederbergia sp. NSJ-179]MCJ7841217.1 NAD-dependent epimerase/dehydratase family protein [Lederbergia sp. NSJ-179]
MKTVEELERELSKPSDALIREIRELEGDILILGVGGKIGPSLARMAKRAIDMADIDKRVVGVSRFSSGNLREQLENWGIETIGVNLLDETELRKIPKVKNIIYMAGHKFGTTGKEYYTWAMNTYLPGRIAERFRDSNMVVFSTGNVYPLTPLSIGGSAEESETEPVGEYAQSCLGRERTLEYFSRKYETPMLMYRLNYANDLRYGILLEVAQAVQDSRPIDLSMGYVNVIWQGDASDMALRSLRYCSSPPVVLNVTGPETVSVRWLANVFGELLQKEPIFINQEKKTALLNNASKSHKWFGYPRVSLRKMIDWTADWVKEGGVTINKPTLFQDRKGAF